MSDHFSVREAQLKPEFADCYPGIEPGVWFTAATLAEHLIGRLIRSTDTSATLPPRILNPEHFEFRGAGPTAGARVTLGSRA